MIRRWSKGNNRESKYWVNKKEKSEIGLVTLKYSQNSGTYRISRDEELNKNKEYSDAYKNFIQIKPEKARSKAIITEFT